MLQLTSAGRDAQHTVRDAEDHSPGVDSLAGVSPLVGLLDILDDQRPPAVFAGEAHPVGARGTRHPDVLKGVGTSWGARPGLAYLRLLGIWPQLSLQEMRGVGTPTATQVKRMVSPGATWMNSSGGVMTCGGTGVEGTGSGEVVRKGSQEERSVNYFKRHQGR